MTLRELFGLVIPGRLDRAKDPRVAAVLHDSEGSDAPLLVRLFTMIGTWIGAGLLAVLVVALEIHEIAPLAIALAVGLFAAATLLSGRGARSLAGTQLIWVLALGAQGLSLGTVGELNVDEALLAATGAVLQVITIALVRVPSLQLISTLVGVGFATWFVAELDLPMYPLWVAVPVAGLAIALWIREVPWSAKIGRTWSALAYGLAIGSTIPLVALNIDPDVALAARHVPAFGSALVWLVFAHWRKSVVLQVLALVQLGVFVFSFYYQLDTPLLQKSLWVIGTGVVVLLAAWVARSRQRVAPAKPGRERRSRWVPAIVLSLATSALVIGASLQKQRVLAEGETVLLQLAPVDPRSLMQGDYMVLRYALDDELGLMLGIDRFDELPGDMPRHGKLVITVDLRGVGHFARFDDGSPLAPRERLLEYRLREQGGSRLRIGGEAFFFEEGSADLYAGARFGELVIADDGEAVLVGLRDEDQRPLGVRLHDR